MTELRGEEQQNYLQAHATLNHIHAQVIAANLDDKSLNEINHHIATAKFHLKEMEHAHALGLAQHHELAHDAFGSALVGAQKALDHSGHPEGNNLAGELDHLHVQSKSMVMHY